MPNGKIKKATLKILPTGKYYVSVVSNEPDESLPKTKKAVALDLGIKNFATDQDGNVYENPKNLEKSLKKLRREQKSLSRKKRGSQNYEKQRLIVAKTYERVWNRRNDHHQQLSTRIIRENQAVLLEDLDVKKMIKNKRLSCQISDAGWSDFVRMLEYKADWYGRTIVKIDPLFPSSQTCSACGQKNPAVKDIRIRKWTCPQCGTIHDRDVNAAINIYNEGMKLLP